MNSPRIIFSSDIIRPAQALADLLNRSLTAGNKVVWFVSGGSCIPLAVEARRLLRELPLGAKLRVVPADERFGMTGHADSNWGQLISAGFDTTRTITHPILSTDTDIAQVTARFNLFLGDLIERKDILFGLFGLGADGHTAGLLPHSPLLTGKENWAGYCQTGEYQRITVTPSLLARLDQALVFATGAQKWPAIGRFLQEGPVEDIPARALKKAGKLTLFTDYQGEGS